MALQSISGELVQPILGTLFHATTANGLEFYIQFNDKGHGIIDISMSVPTRGAQPPPPATGIPGLSHPVPSASRIHNIPPPPRQKPTVSSAEASPSVRFAIPPDSTSQKKVSAEPTARSQSRIKFDIRKNGGVWDIYNDGVKIEQKQFQKLATHPNIGKQKLQVIFGKKEAQMTFYVNPAGEYFMKHGEKDNTDWYKYISI